MTIKHDAKNTILGFDYQLLYGLYSLMNTDEDIQEYVEHLEDFSIETKDGHDLFQLKRSSTPKVINDHSEEFWKTLRNWSHDILNNTVKLEKSKFIIITMNKAQENSIPYFLKPEIGSYYKAWKRIHEIGATTGNKNTKEKYYPEFAKIGDIDQLKLIRKISILDNAPTLQEIKNKIKNIIRNDTDEKFVDDYYRDLYGWWRDKLDTILESNEPTPISWSELRKIRKNLRDGYRKQILLSTITRDDIKKNVSSSNNKTYVKQMMAIKKNNEAILDAKFDYEITKHQKIVWISENPSNDSRIKKFEDRVETNYSTKYNSGKDTIASNSKDMELVNWGRKMYDWAMFETNWKIIEDADEATKRGTLHFLADEPRIGWHPNYKKELEALKDVK